MSRETSNRNEIGRYGLLVVIVVLLAIAGYSGYYLYPRFALPSVTGAGLLVVAVMAGIASFFSPCSFPLLVTILAREVKAEKGQALGRALRFGAALATGAILFLILVGVAIALGAAPLFARVTFTSPAGRLIRLVVGVLLIGLGLFQGRGKSVSLGAVDAVVNPLMKRQARLRREKPTLGFGLFGFGYVLAGFG